MLSGLVLIQVDERGNIIDVADDGIDANELDDLLDGDYDEDYLNIGNDTYIDADGKEVTVYPYALYYFGDGDNEDTDGAMKTGSTTISLDGDDWYYYVDNYEIKLYTNEKELTPDDGYESDDTWYLDNWKDWDYTEDAEGNKTYIGTTRPTSD